MECQHELLEAPYFRLPAGLGAKTPLSYVGLVLIGQAKMVVYFTVDAHLLETLPTHSSEPPGQGGTAALHWPTAGSNPFEIATWSPPCSAPFPLLHAEEI